MKILKRFLVSILCTSLIITPTQMVSASTEASPNPPGVVYELENLKIPKPNGLSHLPEDQRAAVNAILRAMSQSIVVFSNFEILLPQTQFAIESKESNMGNLLDGQVRMIELEDLYKKPTSSEAYTLGGGKLSSENIENLKLQAAVIVPSVQYPGMNHKWKVSLLLQKGAEDISYSFHKDLAESYWHLKIGINERLLGKQYYREDLINAKDGLKNILYGLRDSLSLVFGFVEKTPSYSDYEIQTQVAELLNFKNIEEYVRAKGIKDPYLALYDERVAQELYKILSELSYELNANYHHTSDFYKSKVQRLKTEFPNLTQEEIQAKLSEFKNEDFLAAVESKKSEIEKIYPGLFSAYMDHLETLELTYETEVKINLEFKTVVDSYTEKLLKKPQFKNLRDAFKGYKHEHNVERNYDALAYFENEVAKEAMPHFKEIKDYHYTRLAMDLNSIGLRTQADLVRRQMRLMNAVESNEPTLAYPGTKKIAEELIAEKQQLSLQTTPNHQVTREVRIWREKNWNKVLVQKPDGSVEYFANPYTETVVTSNYPFWRIWDAVRSTQRNFKNGLYSLVYENFINGPVGVKSLFYPRKFANSFTIDRTTGELIPKSYEETMVTNYRNLWNWISKKRSQFESEPDSGLSKDFRRPFHIFLNSALIGGVGSLTIAPVQITLTVINAGFTAAGVATSPIWAPITSLFMMGVNATIYDTTSKKVGFRNKFLPILSSLGLKFSVKGIGQTVGGLIGTTYHGMIGAVRGCVGYARCKVRTGYDALVRNLVLKPFGTVPTSNNKIYERVSGPGISSDYYFQIKPEISLLGLVATLETDELTTLKEKADATATLPIDNYNQFLNGVFGSIYHKVSVHGGIGGDVEKQIQESVQNAQKHIGEVFKERFDFYSKLKGESLNQSRRLIRQNREDLTQTLQLATKLVEEFYTSRLSANDLKKFWTQKMIEEGNWVELTKQLLQKTFSSEFLTPLEDTDQNFRFVVEHEGLSTIFQAIESQIDRSKLPKVEIDTPKANPTRRIFSYSDSSLPMQKGIKNLTCFGFFN